MENDEMTVLVKKQYKAEAIEAAGKTFQEAIAQALANHQEALNAAWRLFDVEDWEIDFEQYRGKKKSILIKAIRTSDGWNWSVINGDYTLEPKSFSRCPDVYLECEKRWGDNVWHGRKWHNGYRFLIDL